jgi:hypothetical protein
MRFMAAVGHQPTQDELRLHDDGRDVDNLFWYLMLAPTVPQTSADYVARLIERLHVLHACFEQTMGDLGLLPVRVVVREPAAVFSDVARAAVAAR